jgi:hypothetical protein
MQIKIGKKEMIYVTGAAAIAAVVALSCGKVSDSVVPPAIVETIGGDEPPVISDGDCGDSSSISFCVSAGTVARYSAGPSYSITSVSADTSQDNADSKAYTVDGNLTEWHNLTSNSNNNCAGTVTFTWNATTSKWVAMVPAASIASVTSADCKLVVNADMGTNVAFAEIQTILGTRLNSTGVYSGASAPSAANTSACINCHSRPTSFESAPFAGFSVTTSDATAVNACTTDACRAGLVSHSSIVDNLRFAKYLIGTTSTSSPCISVSDTSKIAVGAYISGTGVTTGTTVSAIPGTCASGQIQASANGAASGTAQLTFSKGTGASGATNWINAAAALNAASTSFTVTASTGDINVGDYVTIRTASSSSGVNVNQPNTTVTAYDSGTGVITLSLATTNTAAVATGAQIAVVGQMQSETPRFCISASSCFTETYKRVDLGNPNNSVLCLKSNAKIASQTATVNFSSLTGLPSGWTNTSWTNTSGNLPRANGMPFSGPWYNTASDAAKICRWILQGAPST